MLKLEWFGLMFTIIVNIKANHSSFSILTCFLFTFGLSTPIIVSIWKFSPWLNTKMEQRHFSRHFCLQLVLKGNWKTLLLPKNIPHILVNYISINLKTDVTINHTVDTCEKQSTLWEGIPSVLAPNCAGPAVWPSALVVCNRK